MDSDSSMRSREPFLKHYISVCLCCWAAGAHAGLHKGKRRRTKEAIRKTNLSVIIKVNIKFIIHNRDIKRHWTSVSTQFMLQKVGFEGRVHRLIQHKLGA